MSKSVKYWESNSEHLPAETKSVLNEYLLSQKLENKAVATITKYRKVLEGFFRDCKIPIEGITSEDIRGWLNEYSVEKKPKTINLVLAVLSSFFQFCLEEEYTDRTVIKKRWKPKIPQSLPKYLDEYEYARVKRIAEQLSVRNRALLLFLFSSGCRVSELTNLNMEDVNLEKRTAGVKGKGGKIRYIHFSEECALVLKDYLQGREYEATDPLFKNKFGNRLLGNAVRKVVKKVGINAELKQSFHPHCCRHTFATNMLARGADLQFIADEMGHSDLNTTRV